MTIEPGTDSVLHLLEVTVRRGPVNLIDRVSWNVDIGQRWVVLGPNGAGKTTVLQIAAGQLHPSAGRVHVLGERIGSVNLADLRPRIGISAAHVALRVPAEEIVRDLVVSAGYGVLGRWRENYDDVDFDRAEQMLASMGMTACADRMFGTLSEGERKRVLAARALMTDPELLLLDEPGAGLDLGGREDLVGRLSQLAADPSSPPVVLVTHHVEEIPPGFTHALLMRDGQVQAAGVLDDVMCDEVLSETFGVALTLSGHGGRYFARAR